MYKNFPYEAALQRLRRFSLVRRRTRRDLICMNKIMHGLLDCPCDAVFTVPTCIGLRGHTFHSRQHFLAGPCVCFHLIVVLSHTIWAKPNILRFYSIFCNLALWLAIQSSEKAIIISFAINQPVISITTLKFHSS